MSHQNQLEIFKATMAHEKHDDFLFYAEFTEDLARRLRQSLNIPAEQSFREYFGMFTPVSVGGMGGLRFDPYKRPDILERYYKGIEITEGSFMRNTGVLRVRGSMYHFTHIISPLRDAESLKELEEFPCYPEIPQHDIEKLKEKVAAAHAQNKVTVCGVGHLYEDAWQIRGYEPFLMDMMTDPDMCDYIFDKIQEKNMAMAVNAAMAGVDMLHTGDDVANQKAMMFPPDIWRKFIKSRWAKVYEAAKKIKPDIKIWYHSDGNISDIIPELIDIGVDILNPVQPECLDIYEVKKKYGKNIVIDGAIGTQSTMPFGTTEDVTRSVQDIKKNLGYDGALMISPTHILEPEVPIENILAFVEECKSSKDRFVYANLEIHYKGDWL